MSSSATKPEVSVFIPVKNEEKNLPKLLGMIYSQKTDRPFEVVVIDSGSTDGTLEILKQYAVRVYQIPPEEFNHGQTRNQGVEKCHGEHVLLMSADALPTREDWLEKILRNFEDPKVAGVYCRQMPYDNARALIKRRIESYFGPRTERIVKSLKNPKDYEQMSPQEKFEFCAFDDVCSCLRKNVWETYKYDEVDFAEDLTWSRKVLLAGYKIVYEPEAMVIHSHNKTFLKESRDMYKCHRQLYRIFGLQCVPSIRALLDGYEPALRDDALYIWRNEKNIKRRIHDLLTLPLWDFFCPYAQYRAVRDQKKADCRQKV